MHRRTALKPFLAAMMWILTLLLTSPLAHALTAPILRVSDSLGNVVTVDSTGTVTFSGNPSCVASVTCSTINVSVGPGTVAWQGKIGAFTVSSEVGTTKPALPTARLDLALFQLASNTGGTVKIEWTDTGFTAIGGTTAKLSGGGTIGGTGSVIFSGYMDNSNTPFGTGVTVGSIGPFTTSSFNGTVNGPGSSNSPFSMTESVTFTLGANTTAGGDFELDTTPKCTGVIGDFVWSDLNHNGLQDANELGINGVTVKLYKGAIIDANLIATTITDTVPLGYPFLPAGANGYYQFPGVCAGDYNVVVDSSQPALSGYIPTLTQVGFPANASVDNNGSPAPVSLPNDNSTDETIDFGYYPVTPLTLQCAGGTGQVGVPYSSSLVPTGGVSPFTYSITTGSLPPGLTLDPLTGAITGTPTTAGTFNFTAKVVDSTNLAAGTVTSNCSIIIAPPPLSALCVSDTTGQVGVAYSSAIVATGGTPGYTFALASGALPAGLTLNPATGAITGTPTTAGAFSFTVKVVDSTGGTALTYTTSNCSITIAPPPLTALCVSDTTGQVGVAYSSAIVATGGTPGYTFALASGALPAGLTLNPATGAITGTPTTAGAFSFTVKVTDSTGGTALTFTTSNCSITIAPPPLTALCVSITTGQVGVPYASAIVASGGTPGYTFALASGALPAGLTLNPSTGAITGTPTTAGAFSFTVKVTDSTGGTALTFTTSNCNITIAPPPLTALCVEITTGQVGVPYASAIVATGGTPGYTFALASGALPAGLTLNPATGAITGTPTTAGAFSFTVKVTDSTGGTALTFTTSNCSITIAPPPLTALCVSITTGQVGVSYASAIVASGGTPGYTFALASGALPAGLTLNPSTGAITGTPTTAGAFSFTVKVTDSTGGTALTFTTSNCSITIAPPPLTALCVSITTGQVGVPYASAIVASGGTPGYTFALASGALPVGLTLNPATGAITGTPTTAGAFSFTVKVTDSTGGTALTFTTSNCSITIAPPPLTALCVSITTGQVGVPYASAIVASGGTPGYTFALASGALPVGLTLNPTNGAITGIPTTGGIFSFAVKVTDSTGGTALTFTTSNCSITIIAPPPLTLACPPTNTGLVGSPFSTTVAAVGGTPGYTYSISAGALPTGLTLNPLTGEISGTPTVPGAFNFTIKVTDSLGATASSTCSSSCGGTAAWDFSSPTGNRGISEPYTVNGLTITAYGYTTSNVAAALYGHNDDINNLGLGIAGTSNNKIDTTHYVQFDLASVIAAGATNAMLTISSVDTGETYSVYGSNTLGSIGTVLLTNQTTDSLPFAIPSFGTYRYISVKATYGIVTVAAVSFTLGKCQIVIAPPINLECGTCGATKGTVGKPFSSTLHVIGGTAPFTFSIVSGLPPGLNLNPTTGEFYGTPTAAGTYTVVSKVTDSKGNSDTATCTIVIIAPPVDLQCGSCGAGKAYTGVAYSASLSASGGLAPYTFSLVSGSSLPPGLTLNTSTGVISGTPTTAGTYTFTTKVVDANGSYDTATCTIIVVSVVNLDCGSCGAGKAYKGTPYSSQLSVSGGTGPYTYSLVTGSSLPPGLTLNTSTGAISGTPTTTGTYTFTTKVVDSKGNSDTATCTIVVVTSPVNLDCATCGANNAKVGSPYSAALGITGGTGPYTFSLVTGSSLPPGLTLNTSTGAISGTPTTSGTYTFTTKVVDSKGSSDTATCTIVVVGSPVNLDCGTCGVGKGKVGTAYTATFSVTGAAGPYTFSKVSGTLPGGLTLGTSTGKLTGTPTTAGTYTFSIKVVAANGSSDTVTCTVIVVNSPVTLDCGSCGSINTSVGASYSAQLTATGGTAPYTFSVATGSSLPPGLTLNSSTGKITGTPTTAGTYTFTTKVVDSKGNADTATCTIVVTGPPLDLACGTCGANKATKGSAYSVALKATGGNGPYTYAISSGVLPGGLTLNASTGVISGTPTMVGTFTFTSKVTDSKGKTDTATCTIVVVAPVDLQCGACGSANKAYKGTAYSALLSVSGGTGPYTFSLATGSSLPAGLTLNASTGKISGTPTATGAYTFTTKVVDSNGSTDTVTCTLVVSVPPIDLQCGSCGSSNAIYGKSFSVAEHATGGTGTYTYTITSGSLPPGLTLNSSTGVISGTAVVQSGTYTFTTKVADNGGNSDTAVCTITVSKY